MNIKPLQFNFIQYAPKSTVTSPMRMRNQITADTVSFSGNNEPEKKPDPLDVLVPKNQGTIFRKVRDENGKIIGKEKVKVDIVNGGGGLFEFQLDGKTLGGVIMSCINAESQKAKPEIKKDYEEEGIVGDRIYVDYVINYFEEEYGGMGHLADLLEVAACKEKGFDTNVISYSKCESSPLHYVRGKRFIPFSKYDKNLCKVYDNKDPNDIVKEVIDNTPKDEKFDTSKIRHYFIMYMPKEQAKELEEELKANPIF